MKKCLNVVIAITLVAALVPVAFAQQSPIPGRGQGVANANQPGPGLAFAGL